MNTLLDSIGALKEIEMVASGKTPQRTDAERLDVIAFLARSMARDLAYHVQDLARKSAEAVVEAEALTHAD